MKKEFNATRVTKMLKVAVPVLSVLLAFLIGCIIMAALGANPATALQYLFKALWWLTSRRRRWRRMW